MRRVIPAVFALVGFVTFGLGVVLAQEQAPDPETVTITPLIEGLRNPLGLALLPDGGLLIAEEGTGEDDLSAGVSLRQPDGTVGRLVSGLPSGRDSGDLSGVAMVSVSPDGRTMYIGRFETGLHSLLTLPLNPDEPLRLPENPFGPDDLGTAMEAFNRVTLTNPFDMAYTADGVPVVADASQNGVAMETADGRTRFFHRFDRLASPANPELTIDAVPTGITRVGDEYFVTLTGGCPYPAGGGELVAIDTERNQRTVVDNLNMPIDVARANDGTLWLLEFAQFSPDGSCFSGMGYLPNTGRLSRVLADGTVQPVVENLDFPGAVLPLPDGSLYVTEIFDGQVLHITFEGQQTARAPFTLPQIDPGPPQYRPIADTDAALRAAIIAANLTPDPGAPLREGDTALARLGRDLFFDPILAGDMNISCATCHHPEVAMADARVLPIGAGGEGLGPERDFLTHITLAAEYNGPEAGETVPNPAIGAFVPRNSPTIINSALFPAQFWDGRVQSYALNGGISSLDENVNALQLNDVLAVQALFPVISRAEMSGATFGDRSAQQIRNLIAARLEQNPTYRARFDAVFGAGTPITPVEIVAALAAFERQLIFTDAPWDAYLRGESDALTPQQKRGALLFYGELNPAVNCAACHSGDMLSDFDFHNLLVPQLGPGKGNGPSRREDWGRANVTFDVRDRYQFRTPSLRNVALTAPYFHTGAYPTLEAAIRHHANVWDAAANYDPSANLPEQFFSSLRPFDPASMAPTVAPELANGLPLTEADIADLTAFMHALTDPAAADLSHLTPERVPSGLPLDPVPDAFQAPVQLDDSAAQLAAADALPIEAETGETDAGGWRFENVAASVGLDFEHGAFVADLYEDPIAMMGAGLCWLDVDRDGWLDLYLVNSHAEDEAALWGENLPQNALYRNDGGQFTRLSGTGAELALRGNGCVAADLNLDGHSDLYISADGPDVLLWNNGDGTFSDGTEAAGLIAPEWNSAVAVGDVNGDGWPDLFIGAYIDLDNKIPNPMGAFPQDYFGLPDRLYLSEGAGPDGRVRFREVTNIAGLHREERTLGAIFTDVDRDGDLDLYIANDGQPNRMYENQPQGNDPAGLGFRLIDLTHSAEVGDAGSGMGVASADYDGDGMFDLLVTNWEAELNALYRNETHEEGYINFRYSTYRIGMRGLGNNLTGWGTALADFDHDTDVDMLTVNGRVPITNFATDPEPVHLYGNRTVETGRVQFLPWTNRVGLDAVGNFMARGSAIADYDNDGDLDIAINQISGGAVLLENIGVSGSAVQVQLTDFQPGAVVAVTLPDGRELLREWHIGSSYLASEDPRMHIGVGEAAAVDVTVTWPDGHTHTWPGVPAGTLLTAAR